MSAQKRTVEECFRELEPALKQASHLIRTAPLSEDERTELAVVVAAHFFGAAAARLNSDELMFGARELAGRLVHMLRNPTPLLRLIKKESEASA